MKRLLEQKSLKNEIVALCGLSAVVLYLLGKRRASLVPALAGTALALSPTPSTRFRGHSIVITGGSRGLGLALARELVKEGASVTLLARDIEELERAREILLEEGLGAVKVIECDVTDTPALEAAIRKAAEAFDGLDMLINNAGAITVGPWESMENEDFEAQLRLHFYAPLNAIRAALPYLRDAHSGKRIVNICSMGGKVAVPHMLPYDVSKFALSGLSQGLAAELHSEGISITTIYPALMRTGSPIQAIFKGDHEKEFAWFQTGDVIPGFSLDADVAARKIIDAARERRWELTPTLPGQLRMTMASFFPELMGLTMAWMNRLLPRGKSRQYQTGAESRALFDRSWLTKAFVAKARGAEESHNQKPKTNAKFALGLERQRH